MPTMPGPLELIVIGIIALIVFGPDKLPGMARNVGKALHELRRAASDVRSEISAGLEDDEPLDEPDEPEPAKATPPAPDGEET
jgi:TatA/E family protein of Tat protein translocase